MIPLVDTICGEWVLRSEKLFESFMNTLFRSRRRLWSRLFWLAMLIGHAPAQFIAYRHWITHGLDSHDLVGQVVLAISMIFFLLKFIDVKWLRCRVDGRSLVTMTLVVALLHWDCLRPRLCDDALDQYRVVLALTPVLTLADPRWRRRFQRSLAVLARSGQPSGLFPAAHDSAYVPELLCHGWVFVTPAHPLRAPPAERIFVSSRVLAGYAAVVHVC